MYKRQVVVHAKSAAHVDELEPGAFLDQLGVDAGRLVERALDDADVRNLAAQVEVQQLEACLLYTSDAADERSSVDLGGRRIIKKQTRLHVVNSGATE